MLMKIQTILSSPRQRTQLETIASGLLIALGLAAKYLFQLETLHNGLMIAAALIAGSDIALRALVSLRNRHISIELLSRIEAMSFCEPRS